MIRNPSLYSDVAGAMEVSGWSAHCDARRKDDDVLSVLDDDSTEEERKQTRAILDDMHMLEARYEAEDEEMMIRLIKIRDSLWT